MKEIGGYFELELGKSGEFYDDCYRLNSGRNAIQFILKSQKINMVYVPYYTCETVIEPIETLGIEYHFYSIDDKFHILDLLPENIGPNEKIIYINYFGLQNNYIKSLTNTYGDKLLIDNTQAFYAKPMENIDTCYSPRKFFGVLDGGYAKTSQGLKESLDIEITYNRCDFMLGRLEENASEFYEDYKIHNENMKNRPLKSMSLMTRKMLESIDYDTIKLTRERNFLYLHSYLRSYNKLKIDSNSIEGPMLYPFWATTKGLKEYLIKQKIYVATYWPEVLEYVIDPQSFESHFTTEMLALPIDQRYDLEDMNRIVNTIYEYLE